MCELCVSCKSMLSRVQAVCLICEHCVLFARIASRVRALRLECKHCVSSASTASRVQALRLVCEHLVSCLNTVPRVRALRLVCVHLVSCTMPRVCTAVRRMTQRARLRAEVPARLQPKKGRVVRMETGDTIITNKEPLNIANQHQHLNKGGIETMPRLQL